MEFRITLKKSIYFFAIILTIASSCKRSEIPTTPELVTPPPVVTVVPVNDAAQVTASVSGIVLDENNAPIANAVVTTGAATTNTNSNGMFVFQNISLSKENGSVTVAKAGYFKGIRSFKTTEGKNHMVRIQLMLRLLSGTVNAATGGTITSNGGATIVFPANAFATSTGAAYTGPVSVYSRWIDPTAANLTFVIPGDLRGISTTGVENILETYGMVGAELTDASGNALKIATGKKATLSFPIPANLSATAPTSIALWHFDDLSARWKENATATKTGSAYTAQVDKFSFWNVDVGTTNFINLDYTLINATSNSPMVSTSTRIKRANGNYGYGITNNAGFVSGLVPKNELLVLEVVSNCGTVIYSQNINSLSVNTSLGNINASFSGSQTLTFSGTVLNCNAAPISNGYASLYITGGGGGYAAISATGTFLFSLINCSGASLAYNCQAVDNSTSQQSTAFTGFASTGIINLGNINACSTVAGPNVYVAGSIGNDAVLWKNGVANYLTNGSSRSDARSVFVSGTDVYVAGYERSTWGDIAKVWKNGVATNLGGGLYPNGAAYDAYGNSVFVSGTDVYVAGYAADKAIVWKNGIATYLEGSASLSAQAKSVFVSGTDVYVTGTAAVAFPNNVAARLWKNSLTTNLTSSGITDAFANSVFVSGTDVYVAGNEQFQGSSIPKLWKNGAVTNLSNNSGNANSVFVLGTDVYVAGRANNAVVWKNGVATNLANGNEAYSVFVYGTDVYASGYEFLSSNSYIAKIWKNGLPINLSDGTSIAFANSIYVK